MKSIIVGFLMCAVTSLTFYWAIGWFVKVASYSGFRAVIAFVLAFVLLIFSLVQMHGIGRDLLIADEAKDKIKED